MPEDRMAVAWRPGMLARNARYEDGQAYPAIGETAYVQAVERNHGATYLRFGPRRTHAYLSDLFDEVQSPALRDAGTGRDSGEADLIAAAEGQVTYWRKRQQAEKCLEDGISEDGETYTPIGDDAAWQGGYCNGRMSEADWWLKTLQARAPDPSHPDARGETGS